MELTKLRQLVEDGKIFSVQFTKKDGTLRHMVCRTGVRKHTKGGVLGYDREEKGLLGVYEMPNKGYKSITAKNIHRVKAHKTIYE